jgi:hypothetical protein
MNSKQTQHPAAPTLNGTQQDQSLGAMESLVGPHATDSDATSAMPHEVGRLYQACYEAGYWRGRDAGYREGYAEGRNRPLQGNSKPQATSAATANTTGSRRLGLLGLPCERCGTFLYSDETQCPHCKIATARQNPLLRALPAGSVAGEN